MTKTRTFQTTHPWLTFSADLSRAAPGLWLMLGECQSKCEHVARAPLRPDTARELYRVYLAKGVLASTAIEGNTLSEQEVIDHLQGKLELPPSREYLAREIDNIVGACNGILDAIASGAGVGLSVQGIRDLNRLVLAGLELDDGVQPGEYRTHSVGVGPYRGAPAEDCHFLMDRLVAWLDGPDFARQEALTIAQAILKAVLAHLYIAWIHPFGDGNGRTARLVEFQILLAAGVPAASAHLLSNHYNLTRTEYYRQLDRTSKSGGDVLPFVTYAVRGFLDGLKEQIERIWEQQWDVTWRNYVHERFGDSASASDQRKRALVLDLSRQSEPVPAHGIPTISPRLAMAYGKLNVRTVGRDLEEMTAEGLVEKTPEGYRARTEVILAFLPPRAET
jgi:Fic family protein